MKILVIGDPHGYYKYKESVLKKADIILVTGDIGKSEIASKMAFEYFNSKNTKEVSKNYSEEQIKEAFDETYNSTLKIIKYFSQFAPVYTIYGNVEATPHLPWKNSFFKEDIGLTNVLNKIENVKIINNCITNFKGIRIGGLEYFYDEEWIKKFHIKDKKRIKWSKKETDKAKKVLKRFGKNLDILVCHQPPYGVLDKVSSRYNPPKNWIGKHAGSKIILDYIKKNQPRYVFCGHIHEGKGKVKLGKTIVINAGFGKDAQVLIDLNEEKRKIRSIKFYGKK